MNKPPRKWAALVAVLLLSSVLAGGGCAANRPVVETRDAGIRRDAEAGRYAYDAGDYLEAAALYERAIARAQAIGDQGEEVSNSVSAGVSLLEVEQAEAAKPLLLGALYRSTRTGSPRTGEIRLLLAMVDYQLGHLDEAAKQAGELIDAPPPIAVATMATLLRGNIACDQNKLEIAASDLSAVRSAVASSHLPVEPELRELEGKLARLKGDYRQAAQSFADQAEAERARHRYLRMATALANAGQMQLQAGAKEGAADSYYRAGLAALNLGRPQRARQWLTSARDNAASALLKNLAASALEKIKPASAP